MNKSVLQSTLQAEFLEVLSLVEESRLRAVSQVNKELVELYWQLGKYIDEKIASSAWGDGTVEQLADFIHEKRPDLKGFTRRNLFWMRSFYEAYRDNEKVHEARALINWTCHRLILSRLKTSEERTFYVLIAAKERYSSKELDRQISSKYFERASFSQLELSPAVREKYPEIEYSIRDTYMLEFLGLPEKHTEHDLRKGIIAHLKEFLLEFGRDFAFMGEEFRLDVGGKSFYVDLLFFHRGLKCLVAIELKVEEFKPSHMGQMAFYLNALDQDVRRIDENPSVGIILCKEKDAEVVELSLGSSTNSTMVAEYKTKLIDLAALKRKFHEAVLLSEKSQD